MSVDAQDATALPSVSVIMLTYNQAPYVEAACLAILDQTYAPLDIIICDDCSADETFYILKRIVGDYEGPHHVRLRRNETNLGYVGNLMQAIELAQGDVMVAAYGDDVSKPERVQTLAEVFRDTGALLVFSDAEAIDAHGAPTEALFHKAAFLRTTDPLEVATSMAMYLGASGAWHKEIIEKYGPIQSPLLYDDQVFGFRAALEGRVQYVDAKLLEYRSGIGLSFAQDAARTTARQDNRKRRCKILAQLEAACQQRLRDARRFGLSEKSPVIAKLVRAARKARLRQDFYEYGMSLLLRNWTTPMLAVSAVAAEGLRAFRAR